jgi:hypothetical protein
MGYGPGFASTFLYYFVTTTLVATFVVSQGLGLKISSGYPSQIGLVIGIFAGLLGGYMNRTMSCSIAFDDKETFKNTLKEALDDMGYRHAYDDENVSVYVRSPIRQLLSGKIFVQFDEKDVTIASRSVHIKDLQRRL